MTLQNLSLWDVGIAALLIVVNGAVSVTQSGDAGVRAQAGYEF